MGTDTAATRGKVEEAAPQFAAFFFRSSDDHVDAELKRLPFSVIRKGDDPQARDELGRL
ncbi:MAG TPA: hypothetical protein VIY49_16610 [Bryobacteraceae bacterium]